MPLGKPFFDAIRGSLTGGFLTPEQVDGLNRIMAEWESRQLTDLRWLANILAQSYWESARTWQPILEGGGADYLRSKPYWPYIGAGLIQVTWKSNYSKFGAAKPEDLLSWPVALRALFDGMINGMFTGHKLEHYFNDSVDDPLNARRIVNSPNAGTNNLDQGQRIAGFHRAILEALNEPGAVTQEKEPLMPIPETMLPLEELRQLRVAIARDSARMRELIGMIQNQIKEAQEVLDSIPSMKGQSP